MSKKFVYQAGNNKKVKKLFIYLHFYVRIYI